MKAALLITAAHDEHQVIESAWCFAAALLSSGHSINRVFLQGDAVFLAATPNDAPSPQTATADKWEELITAWSLPATVCIGSADNRALRDGNLRAGWLTGGLGDWVMACSEADRMLQFTGEH